MPDERSLSAELARRIADARRGVLRTELARRVGTAFRVLEGVEPPPGRAEPRVDPAWLIVAELQALRDAWTPRIDRIDEVAEAAARMVEALTELRGEVHALGARLAQASPPAATNGNGAKLETLEADLAAALRRLDVIERSRRGA